MDMFSRRAFIRAGIATTTGWATAHAQDTVIFGTGLRQDQSSKERDPGEIFVGNELISRRFITVENQLQTSSLRCDRIIHVRATEFEVVCRTSSGTVLLNPQNVVPQPHTISSARDRLTLVWKAENPSLEIRVNYQAAKAQPYIFKWVEIIHRSSEPITIEKMTVDALDVDVTPGTQSWFDNRPLGGGLGIPVMLGNQFFLGIEHPAAVNEVAGHQVELSHHPFAELGAHIWRSKRAVLGAAHHPDQSVEDAFRQYLITTSGRPPVPRAIYCDWGTYHDDRDKRPSTVPYLTEQLSKELLDELEKMKSDYGLEFDYFLTDAYWFDPKEAFRQFKKPNWPNGFAPVLSRIKQLGMKSGLWFDIGGSSLDYQHTPGWTGPDRPCLSDAEFIDLYKEAIAFQERNNGLSLIKFDYTRIYCAHDRSQSSLSTFEKNVDGVVAICANARAVNPDVVIQIHNVYSRDPVAASTMYYDQASPVSPWWLLSCDSAVATGDVRMSEVPSVTSVRDSTICYTDQSIRSQWSSMTLLSGIHEGGDCVVRHIGLASPNEGLTDAWLLSVMRGTMTPTMYGILNLLSESDKRFMAATLKLLRAHQDVISQTKPILGAPSKSEVYGYCAQSKDIAFVTIINPGLFPQSFSYPVLEQTYPMQKVLFSNDSLIENTLHPFDGVLEGKLVPGEIRVYVLGGSDRLRTLSLPPAPTRVFHNVTAMMNPFGNNKEAQITITSEQVGRTLALVIQYWKDGRPDRSYKQPQRVISVAGQISSQNIDFVTVPYGADQVWALCSWAVFKYRVKESDVNQVLNLKLEGQTAPETTFTLTSLWLS